MIPVRNFGFVLNYPKQKDKKKKRSLVEHSFAWLNAFKSVKNINLLIQPI
jgi:hypothetical protein